MVDYVRYWSRRTGIGYRRIVQWIGIGRSKFYQWQDRYGKVNEHNGWIPRDFWLCDWEKQAILDFWNIHNREGYRRMTYMMLDARRLVADYVRHYNTVRLHSAISYITPLDKLEGRTEQICAARDTKLEAARQARQAAAIAQTQEGEQCTRN